MYTTPSQPFQTQVTWRSFHSNNTRPTLKRTIHAHKYNFYQAEDTTTKYPRSLTHCAEIIYAQNPGLNAWWILHSTRRIRKVQRQRVLLPVPRLLLARKHELLSSRTREPPSPTGTFLPRNPTASLTLRTNGGSATSLPARGDRRDMGARVQHLGHVGRRGWCIQEHVPVLTFRHRRDD